MSAEQTIGEALVEVEAARVKALAHPLRHRIAIVLAEREASPAELAEEFGEKLHTVAYHVRYLAGRVPANRTPLIELVGTDTRRGGKQHFYKAIDRPVLGLDEARELSHMVREDSSAAIIPRVIADMVGAQRAGTFDADPERTLYREHHRFDAEAMEASAQLAAEFVEGLAELAAESANRHAADGRSLHAVATETLIFRVPGLYFAGT